MVDRNAAILARYLSFNEHEQLQSKCVFLKVPPVNSIVPTPSGRIPVKTKVSPSKANGPSQKKKKDPPVRNVPKATSVSKSAPKAAGSQVWSEEHIDKYLNIRFSGGRCVPL